MKKIILILFCLATIGIVKTHAAFTESYARVVVTPVPGKYTSGETLTLELSASLQAVSIDGIQVFGTLSLNTPATITYARPQAVAGLSQVLDTFTLSNDNKNASFSLSFITIDPTIPFDSEGLVSLGTITINSAQPGRFTLRFDNDRSKAIVHNELIDILTTPPAIVYDFALPTPTPTPTTAPPPTATPTPTPSSCKISDFNKDGNIDTIDFGIISINYFVIPRLWTTSRVDINHDGVVDITDYSLFAKDFGTSTGPCI